MKQRPPIILGIDIGQRGEHRACKHVLVISAATNKGLIRVSDNVFTRTLARAIEVEGSAQSLAHLLHAPEGTLLRWSVGRADMPVRAFTALVEYLSAAETRQPANDGVADAATPQPSSERLDFRVGNLLAHCARCEGSEFRRVCAEQPLKMTSRLACRTCGSEVVHGNLLVKLGHDLIARKRLEALERNRRLQAMQAARTKSSSDDETA
jgi:hypothetical protein